MGIAQYEVTRAEQQRMTERITISVPDELAERVNEQLEYGDNRSEWIRDAIEEKLERAEDEEE